MMKRLGWCLLALSLAIVPIYAQQAPQTAPPAAQAPAGPAPAGAPPAAAPGRGRGPAPPLGPATEPRARDDARHQSFLQVGKAGNIDLLFVGDSITDWWRQENRGLPIWNEYFGSMKAANFGIAGDTTQGVLWRMQNGELEGFQAKAIVFMLGTNTINRNPNDEIAEGDRAIINEFLKRQPKAKVLVLGIFPRGGPADNPFRASIKAINEKLATFADNKRVFYMDIGPGFLTADGTLPVEIMADGLHPTTVGYRIWADAISAKVKELLQ